MGKFSIRSAGRAAVASPVKSDGRRGATHEGGRGYGRDAKSELYLLAVTNMVSENTFYEAASDRDQRFRALVHAVTLEDPSWIARFVPYLRDGMNLRSASVVMAAEYALALRGAPESTRAQAPSVRTVIGAALRRTDEPGEFIGYWKLRTGKVTLPGGVQRGVGDAVARLFSEYGALKYDGRSHGVRLGDVIELTHPRAGSAAQGDLYTYLLDRRHHPDEVRAGLGRLPMITANRALDEMPQEQRAAFLREPGAPARLTEAGFTWEELSGWLNGPMDAAAWGAVLPSMGFMARLRNLRNFDKAGLTDAAVAPVIAMLSDPVKVARSRQFPFRFLAAYRAAPSLRWAYPLEQAVNHSLAAVPSLPGRTLILIDRSGSMWAPLSARSDLNRADAAAIFGTALAARAQDATLVQFGTTSQVVARKKGESVMKVLDRFGDLGGTNTASALRERYAQHDRVVIVTDEQVSQGQNVDAAVPPQVPLYTWNLAGYQAGHTPSGHANRHTFGGLTDAAFRMIPLIEAGKSADWPF
ncbi:TROVE domain-containing protein [Kineosporia sp. NBRC 101731]|uniref:TROVE domain-containing protein n=1 Tax=Kineosporia sp. NBRC 101731 TaxID=3032199 RepID=UPI0024A1E1A7|nr:TROVE domain-containing protein [Kineosporia sp. NBRC 101731]GLY31327.1 RNA-binding protein [Kineosporia sp. NBRC 101731]